VNVHADRLTGSLSHIKKAVVNNDILKLG